MSAIANVVTHCPKIGCSWDFVGDPARGRLRMREHIDLMHGGAVIPAAPTIPDPKPTISEVKPVPSRSSSGPSRPKGYWTRDSVIAEIQQQAERLQRPPMASEDRALSQGAERVFGSWGDALEAAGFDRPTRGRKPGATRSTPKPPKPPSVAPPVAAAKTLEVTLPPVDLLANGQGEAWLATLAIEAARLRARADTLDELAGVVKKLQETNA